MKSYNGFSAYQRQKGSNILKQAIDKGILEHPNNCKCSFCGQDKGIRHYHNEDYSEDKVVTTAVVLCWRCHMMLHGRFKHPLSFAQYIIDIFVNKKKFEPVFRANDFEKLEIHYID